MSDRDQPKPWRRGSSSSNSRTLNGNGNGSTSSSIRVERIRTPWPPRSINQNGERNFSRGGNRGSSNGIGSRGTGSRGQGHSDRRRNDGQIFALGFQKLNDLVQMTVVDDIILDLDKHFDNFSSTITQPIIKDDLIVLLVQLLGEKICAETSFNEKQNKIIAKAVERSFLDQIMTFSLKLTRSQPSVAGERIPIDRSPLRFIKSLLNFYTYVSTKMPNLAVDSLLQNIDTAQDVLDLLKLKKVITTIDADTILDNLKSNFSQLHSRLEEIKANRADNQNAGSNRGKKFNNNNYKRQGMTEGELERLYLLNPNDREFTQIEIAPTTEEITTNEFPQLRPNLIHGAYPSALVYLDVQFRLLRADFLLPLKESIHAYLTKETSYSNPTKKLPPGTVRFYQNVKLSKVEVLAETTIYWLKFMMTKNLSRVKWDRSKRLLTGSLILLTADKFKTVYFATVTRRDENKLPDGIIGVTWESNRPPDLFSGDVSYLLIESEVYYEAYRHNLRALQIMGEKQSILIDAPLLEKFKMAKYIVNMSTDTVPVPEYLRQRRRQMDFSSNLLCNKDELVLLSQEGERQTKLIEEMERLRISGGLERLGDAQPVNDSQIKLKPHSAFVGDLHDWPSASELGMDDAQYKAFQCAMTQELSIIQGPPGTGKTYIGLQIVKLMLSNPRIIWGSGVEDLESPDEDEEMELGGSILERARLRIERRRRLQRLRDLRENSDIESPILIVCYTNHALDQFLEGIIGIMHMLGIRPFSNLVRVGSRSKVEEMKNYSLHSQREYYQESRKFDASLARARVIARAELSRVQNLRGNLKDEYKALRNPEGIVNFSELCDYQPELNGQILKSFPDGLRPFLTTYLLYWLGFNSPFFQHRFLNCKDYIQKWFKIVNVSTRKQIPAKTLLQQATTSAPDNNDNKNDENDQDDYNMDELMTHRLDEEVAYEIDQNKRREKRELKYLVKFDRLIRIQRKIDELENVLKQSNLQRDQRGLVEKTLDDLYYDEVYFKNAIDFTKIVFEGVQDGWIKLVNVTDELLARAHEDEGQRLNFSERWAIYFYMIQQAAKLIAKEIDKVDCQMHKAQNILQECNSHMDGVILKRSKVVGMTTTAAAKYNNLLRMMKSRIVIVEEAAEVLESSIVTSLTEFCEHLILIGDHKQLRPSCTVYKLEKDYNLGISLFERLILNKMNWQYLRAQHRMRPEICKLLVPTIYQDLENHSSVYKYPNVIGLNKSLFFVNHSELEQADDDSMTKSNEHEARFLVKLCRHLLLQGYGTHQITILCTYLGQMFLIKKIINKDEQICKGVRVSVVDNFQGEENEIILLSLVRSNEDHRIGFLKTENRICVALSRAKIGLYISGNMDCMLASESQTWADISDKLTQQGSLSEELELKCSIHGDVVKVKSPEDFQLLSPEGGCTKMCPGILPFCNHNCRLICHVEDKEHQKYQCFENCVKSCPEGHPCPNTCSQRPCAPCQVKMNRTLPCGHIKILDCHINIHEYKCQVRVSKTLPCQHVKDLPCHLPVENYTCEVRVNKSLDCGHKKILPCPKPTSEWECIEDITKKLLCGHDQIMKCPDDPVKVACKSKAMKKLPCGHEQEDYCSKDVSEISCTTIVQVKMPICEHDLEVYCCISKDPNKWKCFSKCDTRLEKCGHACERLCHSNDDPEHLYYKCKKDCARSCIEGHPCRKKHLCFENCPPCNIKIEKKLECSHVVNVNCSTDISTFRCTQPCQKIVATCPKKHKCTKKCYEDCAQCLTVVQKKSIDCEHEVKVACHETATRQKCVELVPASTKSLCGHSVEVECKIQHTVKPEELLSKCHQPCGHSFSSVSTGCDHVCAGDCSSCFQGRIHMKCAEKCGKNLACGHPCKFPCSKVCPPCKEQCWSKCQHSKCKKECGTVCVGCKEKCKWSCEHKKCTKRCDEICNRDPCDEPCKLKLPCSHDCIGLCGEQCPPFCRICDKDVVQEILFGTEDEEDARFVYLKDCKHILEVSGMDHWMNTEQEKGEIGVKRCPKCKAVISSSTRYGSIIKRRMKDIQDVKTRIFGNPKQQNQAQIQNKMMNQVTVNQQFHFENIREELQKILCYSKPVSYGRGRKRDELHEKKVDQYLFETSHYIFTWWMEAEKNLKLKVRQMPNENYNRGNYNRRNQTAVPETKQDLTTESHADLKQRYDTLFTILLKRQRPLSGREIEDFEREFNRLNDLYRLYRRSGIDRFESYNGAPFVHNQAKDVLIAPKPYDKSMKTKFTSTLQVLDTILKEGWKVIEKEEKERGDLFRAMGQGANHWYRCGNGHLYFVADCGALNQPSTCPECRARIGGGSGNMHFQPGRDHEVRAALGQVVTVQAPDFSFGETAQPGTSRQ